MPRPRLAWGTPPAEVGWLALALGTGLLIGLVPLPVSGAVLLAAAVLIAILIEPLAGLALTLLAGPFGALENVVLGGTSLDSGQVLLALTLAAWLAHSAARRALRFPRAATLPLVPLLALIGVGALSLLNAPALTVGYKELAKWIQMGLVAWFVTDTAGERESRSKLRLALVVGLVLLAGVSQALIGIWQFALRGHGPEHFEILGRFYRAYGTFEQPNPYAGFLGLTLPLALGIVLGTIGRQSLTPRRLLALQRAEVLRLAAALVVALFLALALLMSWSRGGWLGAGAALLAMLFFLPRRRWVGLLLIGALILGTWGALTADLVPAPVASRLTGFAEYIQFQDARGVDVTPENHAVLERIAHWQAALSMADHSPWLGVGFGNYETAYDEHALINWPYPLGHAHNYYLNLLAEVGILGLVSYLAFWAAVFWLTGRLVSRSSGLMRGLALGLIGSWTHLAVHQLVDKLYVNNIYLHLGALLGILLLLESQATSWPAPTLLSPRKTSHADGD